MASAAGGEGTTWLVEGEVPPEDFGLLPPKDFSHPGAP
jgi:hypothetical protein